MLTRRTSFLASIHEVDDEPEIFVTASYSVRPHNSVTLSATIVSPLRGLSNLDEPNPSDVGEEGFPNASLGITWQKRTTPIGEVGNFLERPGYPVRINRKQYHRPRLRSGRVNR